MKSGKDDHTQKLHDALKKQITEGKLLSNASVDEDALKLIKAARLTVGDGDGYVNQLDKILDNDIFRTANFSSILNAKNLGTLLVNNRYLEEGSEIKTEYDEYVEQVKKVNSTFPSATSRNKKLSPITNVSAKIHQELDEETEKPQTQGEIYNAKEEAKKLTDSIERKEEEDELEGDEKRIVDHHEFPILPLQTLSEIHKPEEAAAAAAATKIQRVFKNYSKQRDSEKTRLGKLVEGLLETNLSYNNKLEKKEEELKGALYGKAEELVSSILGQKENLQTLQEQLKVVEGIETTKKTTVEDIKILQPKSKPVPPKTVDKGKSLFAGKVSQPSKNFAKEEKKKKEDRKDPSKVEGQKR